VVKSRILSSNFYNRPTLIVARELIGARLVRILNGQRLSGIIVETEAYIGGEDLGCHAKAGKTPRNEVMFGRAGRAYVYFTYGMHWMLNAVTEAEGFPAAVLLRAIAPVEGVEIMSKRRNGKGTDGPAKLTQALSVDIALNGIDLTTRKHGLWIEAGDPIPDSRVTKTPRVGLYTVPEPWKSKPWRFFVSSRRSQK
jgi:DNA-3-methyladenine glycosylase